MAYRSYRVSIANNWFGTEVPSNRVSANSLGSTGSSAKSLYGTSGDIRSMYGTSGLGKKAKDKDFDYDIDNSASSTNGDAMSAEDLSGDFAEEKTSGERVDAGKLGISTAEEKDGSYYWKLTADYLGMEELPIKIKNANEALRARFIQHPVEDGTVRMDNKVVEPINLSVRGFVKAQDVKRMAEVLEDCRTSKELNRSYLTLISPLLVKKRMWVVSYTKNAAEDKVDVFEFDIQLQEVLLSTSLTAKITNPDFASPR